MSETQFWSYVATHCYNGRLYVAEIDVKGVTYINEASIDDGPNKASKDLFERLKSKGLIIPDEQYYK